MSRKQSRSRTDERLIGADARLTSEAMRRFSRAVTQQMLAFAPPPQRSVRDAIERFRAEEMGSLRPRTRDWMCRYLKQVERAIGKRDLDDEFRATVLRWYDTLPPTVANKMAMLLGRVLRMACYWGWRSRQHDLLGLCGLRRSRKARKILTLPQRVELSTECARPTTARRRVLRNCIKFILLSGWRSSEACDLRRDELERDEVVGVWLPITKTTDGPQYRVLNPDAVQFLDSLPNDGPWYFPHYTGTKGVSTMSVLGEFKKIAKDKGWPDDLCCMSMRHTFSTVGAQQKLSPSFVAALVGNTAKTQQEYYIHPQSDDLLEAAICIGKALVVGRRK